ncbi:unnamed protein product [Linum tenue]|uniref:Oleosin n=1 Tax=Linum tenue TaxID=586396 RepID=A0AAV0NCR8_9ROSI|nr:unnamed protein product [Linum tenue]
MGDRGQQHRFDAYGGGGRYGGGLKGDPHQRTGPSPSKVLAVVTMLPVGGTLLALAGIILFGTLIGLAVATPVFIICSPVIVPAALLVAFAVTAFLTSGLAGATGLTALSWFAMYLRQAVRAIVPQASQAVPETMEQAKRRMQDAAGYAGQKTKEVGQEIQRKAQETK